jgi:phage terminase small subunit
MAQPGVNRQRKKGLLTPLDYMLGVINDPTADTERRDRLAVCAAQYCHPRAANHPKGKKAVARDAAAEAGDYGWGDDLKGNWPQ